VRQHVIRSAPRPAPLHLARLAAPHVIRTRDASDRLLPSHFFVPVPAPRRFSMRRAVLATRAFRVDCLMHVSATLASAGRKCPSWEELFIAVGVIFPPQCVRTEPLTPLSPLSLCRNRSHVHGNISRAAKIAPLPSRVNEPALKAIGSDFHRAKTSAPRRSLERPARASPGSAAWPPRCRSSTLLKPPDEDHLPVVSRRWVWFPSTRPDCQRVVLL